MYPWRNAKMTDGGDNPILRRSMTYNSLAFRLLILLGLNCLVLSFTVGAARAAEDTPSASLQSNTMCKTIESDEER